MLLDSGVGFDRLKQRNGSDNPSVNRKMLEAKEHSNAENGTFNFDANGRVSSVEGKKVVVNTKRVAANQAIASQGVKGYFGASTDATTLDAALAKLDAQQAAGTLTASQVAAASVYLRSPDLAKTLFNQGTSLFAHNQQEQNRAFADQNQRFMQRALDSSKGKTWVDYDHSKTRQTKDSLDADSRHDVLTLGGAFDLNSSHTVAVGAHHSNSRWEESFHGSDLGLKTRGYGLNAAYVYHAPYAINVFGQLGYSRLNYKVAGDDTRANQYALGLGVNKAFSLGSATLTPEFTLSHIWARANRAHVSSTNDVDNGKARLTVARVALNGSVPVGSRVSIYGGVGLARDLQAKADQTVVFTGLDQSVNETRKDKQTRVDANVGANFAVTSNVNLYLAARHSHASRWHNTGVNAG